jgi:hypothetical protein
LKIWQRQKRDNAKKKRADKYETKPAMDGTFDDMIKVFVEPMPKKVQKKKHLYAQPTTDFCCIDSFFILFAA